MLATPHTTVGILIASKIPNPIFAFPLALLSHFVLDLIPHWDFFSFQNKIGRREKVKVILDFLIGLSLGMFFTLKALPDQGKVVNTFFSSALANLPDAIESPYVFFGYRNKIIDGMIKLQHCFHSRLKYPWGLIPQIFLLALSLALLLPASQA